MSYDDILTYIGEFGPYQKRVTLLIILVSVVIPFHIISVVFSLDTPEFRCAVPGLNNDTFHIQGLEHAQLVNKSVPYDENSGKFSECTSYLTVSTNSGFEFVENKTQDCKRWVYSKKVYETSIIADLNLVCDRQIYRTHANMMMMLGLFVGSLVCGPVSDVMGRKKLALSFGVIHWALGISFGFISSVPALLALKFGLTLSLLGQSMGCFVLTVELAGPSKRAVAGIGSMFGWCLGLYVLLAVFYLIPNWSTAHLVLSAPTIGLLMLFWVIPESPRWLMSRGRYKEAEKILEKMAKVNNKQLPEEQLQAHLLKLEMSLSDKTEGETNDQERIQETVPGQMNVLQLLTDKSMILRIFILCFNWSALNICYYGLAFNVGYLIEGNIHLNFFIQAVMETLSKFVTLFFLNKVGRARLYCVSIIIGGLACLGTMGTTLTNSDKKWINSALSGIGRCGAAAAFAVIYIFTAELLPTFARNSGLGVCSCAGRIGGLVSPYIVSLSMLAPGQIGKALPLIIFGVICAMSGLLALLLPETRDQDMPETTNDARNLTRLTKDKEIDQPKEGEKFKDVVGDETL